MYVKTQYFILVRIAERFCDKKKLDVLVEFILFKLLISYQGFIQALLLMSVLWKKIDFYEGERNRKSIVIVAGCLGAAVKRPHKALNITKISCISDACDVY